MSQLEAASEANNGPYGSDMTDAMLAQNIFDLNRSVAKLNAKLDTFNSNIDELKALLRERK